jgi:type IV secretory pathway TrbL component
MDKEVKLLKKKILDHKVIAVWIAIAIIILLLALAVLVLHPALPPLNAGVV